MICTCALVHQLQHKRACNSRHGQVRIKKPGFAISHTRVGVEKEQVVSPKCCEFFLVSTRESKYDCKVL